MISFWLKPKIVIGNNNNIDNSDGEATTKMTMKLVTSS